MAMSANASAPGKAILVGEHAVVYGMPAIALPLPSIRARAAFKPSGSPLTLIADDLARPPFTIDADQIDCADPLALMAGLTMQYLGAGDVKGEITIRSDIPIASGLGSSAAVSAALGRAIAQLRGANIPDEALNRLVFEVEKQHHGRPSGIDNTVVVYESPVYFVKGGAVDFIDIEDPLWIAVADTGIASLTRDAVADVRSQARRSPARTARVFGEIGAIVHEAKDCIERGKTARLGELMTANHHLLQTLDLSSPELDHLVDAALTGGAQGAKLSGGGRGGNIIALVEEGTASRVKERLVQAGAKQVMLTVAGQGSQIDDSD